MRWMLALALITGCATGPRVGRTPYRPIGGDGYGYSEMRLNERTIQVTFTAVTTSDAQTGALRRAADLAVQMGADGFTIMSREDGADTIVRKRFVVGRVRRNIPATVLTVNLLNRSEFGSAPPGTMVYDARMLLQQSN
jgi:hypothetical protein